MRWDDGLTRVAARGSLRLLADPPPGGRLYIAVGRLPCAAFGWPPLPDGTPSPPASEAEVQAEEVWRAVTELADTLDDPAAVRGLVWRVARVARSCWPDHDPSPAAVEHWRAAVTATAARYDPPG
jgi:hypothetical protein